MKIHRLRSYVFSSALAMLVAGLLAVSNGAPATATAVAQTTEQVKAGRALFEAHCASCHGTSGEGNGPAAVAMRHMPPDITALALANGGVFPAARLGRIIDGRDVEAHGAREMPVWGATFKTGHGEQTEEAVRARIAAILDYLQSIQKRRG